MTIYGPDGSTTDRFVHVTAFERGQLEHLGAGHLIAKLADRRAKLFSVIDAERDRELTDLFVLRHTPRRRFTPADALAWCRDIEEIEEVIATGKFTRSPLQ